MPTPPSGEISLLQIRDELAPGNPSALNLNFYRNQTYNVNGGGTRLISNSPAFSEFYNLIGTTVSYRLDSADYYRQAPPNLGHAASFELRNNNGFYASILSGNTRTFRYNWVSGDAALNYEVIVNPISGTYTSGIVNTWLSLSISRVWALTVIGTPRSVTSTVQIRHAVTLNVVATATIGLYAETNV
jgi:hypothetical protein